METDKVDTKIEQPQDEVMSRVFDLVKTHIAKENTPKKKSRKRTYTSEQRAVMLANLKKGREAKLAKHRRIKAERAEKSKAEAPKKDVVAIEKEKKEPKPKPELKQEPKRKAVPSIAPPVPQPRKPSSPISLNFRFGGKFF